MEQKHTPGPWKVTGTGTIRYIDAPAGNGIMQEVAACMRVEYGDMDANARRIVACVNACEGLDTYLLENSGDIASAATAQAKYIQKIERQRDQLLSALERMLQCYSMADHRVGYCCCGDSMDRHGDTMYCGHSPVDAGEYNAEMVIKDIEQTIATIKEHQ